MAKLRPINIGFDPDDGCIVICLQASGRVVGRVPRPISADLAKRVLDWQPKEKADAPADRQRH